MECNVDGATGSTGGQALVYISLAGRKIRLKTTKQSLPGDGLPPCMEEDSCEPKAVAIFPA